MKRIESLHRTRQLFDEAMILLNDVIEIFDLADFDQPVSSMDQQQPVLVLQSSKVCTALIDDDFLRPAIVVDCASRKGAGCVFIAMLRQHEIKSFG